MSSGIYKIINKSDGKFYIGSAVDINKRWANHLTALRCHRHHNEYLQHVWDKSGGNCFEFVIVEYCEVFELIDREQYYIDSLMPNYNIAPIAGSSFGRKCSLETRKKISDGCNVIQYVYDVFFIFHASPQAEYLDIPCSITIWTKNWITIYCMRN